MYYSITCAKDIMKTKILLIIDEVIQFTWNNMSVINQVVALVTNT